MITSQNDTYFLSFCQDYLDDVMAVVILRGPSSVITSQNDTYFLSFCQDYLDEVMEVVVRLFKDEHFSLIVNADKTHTMQTSRKTRNN